MSYTTQGCELTRVTVVNPQGDTVYETIVKPDNPIIDYNTRCVPAGWRNRAVCGTVCFCRLQANCFMSTKAYGCNGLQMCVLYSLI